MRIGTCGFYFSGIGEALLFEKPKEELRMRVNIDHISALTRRFAPCLDILRNIREPIRFFESLCQVARRERSRFSRGAASEFSHGRKPVGTVYFVQPAPAGA